MIMNCAKDIVHSVGKLSTQFELMTIHCVYDITIIVYIQSCERKEGLLNSLCMLYIIYDTTVVEVV